MPSFAQAAPDKRAGRKSAETSAAPAKQKPRNNAPPTKRTQSSRFDARIARLQRPGGAQLHAGQEGLALKATWRCQSKYETGAFETVFTI